MSETEAALADTAARNDRLAEIADDNASLEEWAWRTAAVACLGLFLSARRYDTALSADDLVFTDTDDEPEKELGALVDKIGARATPEILWNHLRLKHLTDKPAMTPWYRAALASFIAVYRDLKAHADEQEALLRAAAPAPPKKPVDPDALTTGTVDGFFATGRTK